MISKLERLNATGLNYRFQLLSSSVTGVVLVLGLSMTHALAATWTGNIDNDWGTAGNWDNNAVPTSGSYVVINNSSGPVLLQQSIVPAILQLGYTAGTNGALTISGANTIILATNSVSLGAQGTSTINIENGAQVETPTLTMGGGAITAGSTESGAAYVFVSGVGTLLRTDVSVLGSIGPGTMKVSDGAKFVASGSLIVGGGTGSMESSGQNSGLHHIDGFGSLTVSGAGTILDAQNTIVSQAGNASVLIADGAQATFTAGTGGANYLPPSLLGHALTIGGISYDLAMTYPQGGGTYSAVLTSNANFTASGNNTKVDVVGDVIVSGFSSKDTGFVNNAYMQIDHLHDGIVTGTLNVTDGARMTVTGKIQLTADDTPLNVASVNIGTGGAAGTLSAASIIGGAGSATVNFNHTDAIDFNVPMTGHLSVNQMNSGSTTLVGANDYGGTTTVSTGSLLAGSAGAFSPNSDFVVSGGVLNINGFDQTIASLSNGGTVNLNGCSNCAGNTLTVTGNYVGNVGSVVSIGTVLGDDTSLTDKLAIGGNSSGSSTVKIVNENGKGAQTNEGIEVITVGGSSDATFTLSGNSTAKDGTPTVTAGAYAYRLLKGNASGSDVKDWYLRSELNPVEPSDSGSSEPSKPMLNGGAPVYESYAQSLLGLNGVSTLQQRVSNRVWAGNGNRVIAQGADAVQPIAPAEKAGQLVEGNGVWGRIEGSHSHIEPKLSTTGTEYNQNVFKLQAGVDGKLSESEAGSLIGGVYVQYVHGKTTTSSADYHDGEIATDGYGFGGTLTWYGDKGFYVDAQAQATWYNSDLSSSSLGHTTLKDGNNGYGYALSLEAGQKFALNEAWSLTPQAQLVYSRVNFDSFNDDYGAAVSLDKGASLQGRIGLMLDHETSWQNANGMTDRTHVYGIANLYNEFLDGTRVDLAGVSLASRKDRVWGGLGLGGSYNWDNDKYSIYGEGLVNTSLNNFGDSYSVKGNIGFRVKW